MKDDFDIVTDEVYGYRRLEPRPSSAELSDFYQSQYPELLAEGDIGESLSRLLADDDESEREREWMIATEFHDVAEHLENGDSVGRILDIGCGTGDFLQYMADRGWRPYGIEPADAIREVAESKGIDVFPGTVEEYQQGANCEGFDAVTMWNVLEHVPHPGDVIEICAELLVDGGSMFIKVPNEFNPLQFAAMKHLDLGRFWVNAPVHINYFDFRSLEEVVTAKGFTPTLKQTNFPMSLFLLLGFNYVENPDVGSTCHWRRVDFELAVGSQIRRDVYRSLVDLDIGRSCLMAARI